MKQPITPATQYTFLVAPYKLEKRFCKCGCGNWFRVLEGSPSWYASIFHNPHRDPTVRPIVYPGSGGLTSASADAEMKPIVLD